MKAEKTEAVWIHVTRGDVWNGILADCIMCPIARAITRRMGDGWRAAVHKNHSVIYVTDKFGRARMPYMDTRIPQKAIRFIKAFDAGETPKPIRFQMQLPEECLARRAWS